MVFGNISSRLERHGFEHHGFAALEAPLTIAYYRQWLARGDHADMHYLEEHAEWKANPRDWAPRARTAIVVAQPYLPHPYPRSTRLRGVRIAQYARGSDYHYRFLNHLEEVAIELRDEYGDEEFLCYTDAAPILERDLANRAGLGWYGKNTCLIDPDRGSFFLLGQILTTLAPPESPAPAPPDFCGTCTRCLDACPTGALEEPRRLNARKCISYWTIEAKTAPPADLRARFGDWFFGCDICQTVCPWNIRAHGRDVLTKLAERAPRESLIEDLRWILNASGRGLLRGVDHTPLTRARPATLKRNALVVIANECFAELRPEVERAALVPDLKEVARWTLERLGLNPPV